jgi:hypothetical protein
LEEDDERSDTIEVLLDAIRVGDALAVHCLVDLVNESGDERLNQVRKAWQEPLGTFAAGTLERLPT